MTGRVTFWVLYILVYISPTLLQEMCGVCVPELVEAATPSLRSTYTFLSAVQLHFMAALVAMVVDPKGKVLLECTP